MPFSRKNLPPWTASTVPLFAAFLAIPTTVAVIALLVRWTLTAFRPDLSLPVAWYGIPPFPLFRDFRAYFGAAEIALRGGNPYAWSWYLGTPVFARLLAPLTLLGPTNAALLFQSVAVLSWPVLGFLVASRQPEKRVAFVGGSLFLLSSAPFVWALHRANVDPLAGVFLAGAFLALAHARQRVAGVLVTLAFCVKYYALLLLLPLECLGFRRAANTAYVLLVVLLLVMGPLDWLKPFSKAAMAERLGYLMPHYNVSVGQAWWALGRWLGLVGTPMGETMVRVVSTLAFLVAVTWSLVADYRRRAAGALSEIDELVLYCAFFFVFPRQIYPYAAVVTLPFLVVLPRLWRATAEPARKRLLLALALAVGLQHSHVGTLAHLLEATGATLKPLRVLDGFGSLATMILVTVWKACAPLRLSSAPGVEPA